MKHLLKTLTLATVASLIFPITAHAADSCQSSKIKPQTWGNQFNDVLTRSRGFQYPRTSFCIFYSSASKRNQRHDGALFPTSGRMTFKSNDADDGRAEMRGIDISDRQGFAQGDVRIAIDPGNGRQFTVGQLFGVNSSGSNKPIVRIEVDDGNVRAVVRKNGNGGTSTYGGLSVSNGSRFNWEVRQYRKVVNGQTQYHGRVKINGSTVFDQRPTNYQFDKTYTKAGCYMNNGTQQSGCRAEFYNINFVL